MPGNEKRPNKPNRYIKSDLKSKRIVWEEEHPLRWSYMKILREFSTLKEFYPEITPYHEAYKMRDNTWAVYSESFDGLGDPWIYVVNGPKKALVVDTGFGVGNLVGLVEHITGKKKDDILVCNTHNGIDHCLGNCQFNTVYCHEDEVMNINRARNPHAWDYLFDEETGKPNWEEFDREDIIPYKEYELIPLKSNECIDLGDGYLVECVPLRGHAQGHAGWFDHKTGCFFVGDLTSIGTPVKGFEHPENCTIERLRDDFNAFIPRINEVTGCFPGHGMLDQTPTMLQYELDCLNAILEDPENADKKIVREVNGKTMKMYRKNIHQSTAMKYSPEKVYYKQIIK